MRWMILCNSCVDDVDEENIVGWFQAKYGFQGEGAEGAILACQEWDLPHDQNARKFFCDECGTAVAVAGSSQWFIEEHRRERDIAP